MAKVMRNFLNKGSTRDDIRSADSDSDDEDGLHETEVAKPGANKGSHTWRAMRDRVSVAKVGAASKGIGARLRGSSKTGDSFGKDDAGAARMKTRMSKAVMSTITGMTRSLHLSSHAANSAGAGFEEEVQALLQQLVGLEAVQDLERATAERLQPGSGPEDHSRKLSALRDFRDAIARESLAVTRRHSSDLMKSLENREAKATCAEKQARDMQVSYLREVTALRDKIRRLPPGTTEAIDVTHLDGLSYVDDAIKELVRTCCEERLKQFFAEAAVDGDAGQLHFFLKSNFDMTLRLSEQRAEDATAQVEAVAVERDDARTELASIKGNLDEARLHVNALEVCIAARDDRVVELTEAFDGVRSELQRLKRVSSEVLLADKPPCLAAKAGKAAAPLPQAYEALSPEAQLEAVHMEMQWANLVDEARGLSAVEPKKVPELESLLELLGRAADLHSNLAREPAAGTKELLEVYSQIEEVREQHFCHGDAEKLLLNNIQDAIGDCRTNLALNFNADPISPRPPRVANSATSAAVSASPHRKPNQAPVFPKASATPAARPAPPHHAKTVSAEAGEFKQVTTCELFVAEPKGSSQLSAAKRACSGATVGGGRGPSSQAPGLHAPKAAAKSGGGNAPPCKSTRKAGTQHFSGPSGMLH